MGPMEVVVEGRGQKNQTGFLGEARGGFMDSGAGEKESKTFFAPRTRIETQTFTLT